MPEWTFHLLRRFCPPQLLEEVEGDLIQRFNRDYVRYGVHAAKRGLFMNVIRFFRPGILMRNRFNFSIINSLMLRNQTLIIIRQAGRNKIVSGVNVIGLTLAITVCLLIAQFALFEFSFENFNKNADRTYRINLYNTQNGVYTETSSATVPALAYSIKQSIPGIESIARVSSRSRGVVANRERQLMDREDDIVFADPAVIDVLGIELINAGNTKTFGAPHSVLISESIATKYFGSTNVTGRILEFGFNNNSLESTPYEIVGVFKDLPPNTQGNFQIILPPVNGHSWNENWAWSDVRTYVVLSPGTNPTSLDSGLARIVQQHHQDSAGDKYLLEPLTDIRLHALDGTGRSNLVNFFILLGSIILLLAWFNYTNLSTARFVERMKEVGIRKLIGASRTQLVIQFFTETFLYNVVSFGVAIVLVIISWPHLSVFIGPDIPLTLLDDRTILVTMTVFVSVSTLSSGLYPSLYLSSFKPISSLKGAIAGIGDRASLRKLIVTVQMSVSIALITAAIAIQRQIEFMRSQNLGIAIDQTLVIEEALVTDAKSIEKYQAVKNEILKLTAVKGVTNASSFPGKEIDWHRTDIFLGEENVGFRYNSRIIAIGTEFLDLFGVQLVAGRNFDAAMEGDKRAMLISEEASKMFAFSNYQDALGKVIFIGSRRFEVIGVTKNYHYQTLQSKVEPLLYMQSYPRGPAFAIKVPPERIQETIPELKKIWERGYPGNVFRYYFLDEFFDHQYRSDIQNGKIVTVLTALAIVIACSGLFALSLYSVEQKAKEIGIRKILGATFFNVVLLLSRDKLILVVIGGLITIPLMYYGVSVWLNGYAYKMPLDAWMFIVPCMTVLLLVLMTISFQTVAAARRNPVENMRHE